MELHISTLQSPVGPLRLVASPQGLVAVLWPEDREGRVRFASEPLPGHDANPHLRQAAAELREYFAGRRRSFGVALDPHGTEFQKSVWRALATIPFGETRSYAEIARQIKKPTASRAVGAANGRNPLSIIVPCHRVIGSNGALTGFAGGISAKEYLLRLEGRES